MSTSGLVAWFGRRGIYYGWVIVAVMFVTLFVSLGFRFAFGTFYSAIIDETGWLRAETAGMVSASMIVYAATAALVGYLFDRFGARVVFPIGALCMGLGLMLASASETLAGLTGLLAALAGLVLWSVDVTPAGIVLALAGGGLAAIALLTEIKGGVDLITGRRGAMGSTVVVQLVLAVLLLAGVNFFSFHYYARWDCTRDQLFTIDPSVREQLAGLHGDTSIVVLLGM